MQDHAAPPDLLIHLHLPKTGGTTLNIMLRANFPGPQHFNAKIIKDGTASALWSQPRDVVKRAYEALTPAQRRAVRCVTAGHLPMGVHTVFDRPARYVTVLRDPVDRVVSHFYFDQEANAAAGDFRFADMTLAQYIEAPYDLGPNNFQTRLLSGAAELDAVRNSDGTPAKIAPVEQRHLEMAKRAIEQHCLAAAPLEEFTALVLLLRQIYGWPWRRTIFEPINATKGRVRLAQIDPATVRRIEGLNRFDRQLYDWATERFRAQIAALGPDFARQRRLFETINGGVQATGRAIPFGVKRRLAQWFIYGWRKRAA